MKQNRPASWKARHWNSHKQSSKKKKIIFKNENDLKDQWNNSNQNNMHIVEIPEGKEKGVKKTY